MAEITAALVKELREKTGAGMMDCKSALKEANGDLSAAIEVLRKKGLKDLGKRAGKVAAEGTIGVYVHAGDQVAALVELNCETDFVARGDEFKAVAKDIAMHAAAMRPKYVSIEDIPAALKQKEEEIIVESLPENQRAKADKIVPGKLQKWFGDIVLLEQFFVKDDKKKVSQIVEELGIKSGEKVTVRQFHVVQVGEGLEKPTENLADEVAATITGG